MVVCFFKCKCIFALFYSLKIALTLSFPLFSLLPSLRLPQESLDQARLAVVMESNRVTDLELLSKYNVSLWDLAFQRTSYMKASIDEEMKTVKAASDNVNRRRKQEHTQAASTLQQLGEQYEKNITEQYVISARKIALEASVTKMRKIVTEKGIGAVATATASR